MPNICLHRLNPLRESHCGLLNDDGTYKLTNETDMPVFCNQETLKNVIIENVKIRVLNSVHTVKKDIILDLVLKNCVKKNKT